VTWEQPEDARLFWMYERVHCPRPLTPLSHDLVQFVYQNGIGAAAEDLEFPIRARSRAINTYVYMAIYPVTPPEEMEAQGKRAEAKLGASMARVADLWRDEWFPEIRRHVQFWEQFNLPGASMDELLAHLDESIERTKRLWQIHFNIVFACFTPQSMFEELYRELFSDRSALDAYRLLQGFDNLTLQADRALWQLSRAALAEPAVRQALETHAASDVVASLEGTPAGRAFLAQLQDYLNQFGPRADSLFELSMPRWIEDPTPVIATLKEYMEQPDRDPEAELAALAAERERQVAAAREQLRGYPEPVIGQFEFFLKAAQEGNVVREDHNLWIDFRTVYLLRRVVLEFGRRFAAAGVIDGPDDVFYLTFDDIRATAADLPGGDRRQLVAERRAAVEHFGAITPPPVAGTMPPGPPPADPVGLAMGKVLGVPPPPSDDPHTLRGVPSSSGVTRGPARLIRSLGEAARLQPGDILVAETTLPPWTPLFAIAAAVVTDTGGVLSHAAIVAREYGIPAVVGTGMATAVIQDGQTIEVDGDQGIVRIITEVSS
jgi:pyruvate,water dikinase